MSSVDVRPRRERAGLLAERLGFLGVVQVVAALARARSPRTSGTASRARRRGWPPGRSGSGGRRDFSSSAERPSSRRGRSGGSCRPRRRRRSGPLGGRSARTCCWTVVVPAPDDPVMAMMGCLADMAGSLRGSSCGLVGQAEQAAALNSGVSESGRRSASGLAVVALDALDLLARAEDEPDALVQRGRARRPGRGSRRCSPGRRPARRSCRWGCTRRAGAADPACVGSLVSRG